MGKIAILMKDLKHPSLRLKKIKGTDFYEISANMDIRIAIVFRNGEIHLLDINHHDALLKRRSKR